MNLFILFCFLVGRRLAKADVYEVNIRPYLPGNLLCIRQRGRGGVHISTSATAN